MIPGETIPGLFQLRVQDTPDKPALLERQGDAWVSTSFKEWEARSRAIAAALIHDGVNAKDIVAIFSYSRREWLEADMAVLMVGAVTATIYHNLTGDTVDDILADAAPRIVFAEGPIQVRALFGQSGHRKLPSSIQKIVYFQNRQTPSTPPGKPAPPELSLEEVMPADMRHKVVSLEDYVRQGKDHLSRHFDELDDRIRSLLPDHIAKIIYTSGTTGKPKGAMLSHANLCAVTADLHRTVGIRPSDTTLLFLPLAHVYAQLVYHAQVRIGFTVAFARSMLTAVEDAGSIRPDFFVSVPRLFEKIHDTVLARVESGSAVRRTIFHWASDVGSRLSDARQHNREPGALLSVQARVADHLVYSKLKNTLGGRIRFMVSGGAPLGENLMSFFHAAGLLILEGYGMTENASLSHHNHINRYRFGTVGFALNNVETVIADDGEILIRGPGVMKGYHNLEKDTKEAIDEAGWLHTGDIGEIDSDGFLKITDRKKDLIVTSGGKNIAPAPIEAALCRMKLVSQAVVFGNNRKYLSALITLDPAAAQRWAAEKEIVAPQSSLPQNARLQAAIEAELATLNESLERFETIKKFAIVPREFSIDKGEVTPSLKIRKKVIERNFTDLINSLYPDVPRNN